MQPEAGARFSVRLLKSDGEQAEFHVELATPRDQWSAQASIAVADGAVRWGDWQGEGAPPEWLCNYTRALLRSAWRQHATAGWPRRLTRWRDATD
jgi:hypothetical protein